LAVVVLGSFALPSALLLLSVAFACCSSNCSPAAQMQKQKLSPYSLLLLPFALACCSSGKSQRQQPEATGKR